MLSVYSQNMLRSTCCHSIELSKNGKSYVGIYNGLSYWGRVENPEGELVEELSSDFDEEEGEHYPFTPADFELAGYNQAI